MTFSVNSRNLHIIAEQAKAAGQLFGFVDEAGNPLQDPASDGQKLSSKANAYLDALTNINLKELDEEIQTQVDQLISYCDRTKDIQHCLDRFYPFSESCEIKLDKDYRRHYQGDLAEIKKQRANWKLSDILRSVQAKNHAELRQKGYLGLPEQGCQQEAEWDALNNFKKMLDRKDTLECTKGELWVRHVIELIKERENIMTALLPLIQNKNRSNIGVARAQISALTLAAEIASRKLTVARWYCTVFQGEPVASQSDEQVAAASESYLLQIQTCEDAMKQPSSFWSRIKAEYANNAKFRWGVRTLLFAGFVVANLFSFGVVGGMGAGVALGVKLATILAGAYTARRVIKYCCEEGGDAAQPQNQPAAQAQDPGMQRVQGNTSTFTQRLGGPARAPESQEMKDGPAPARTTEYSTGCAGCVTLLWKQYQAANALNPGAALQALNQGPKRK